jgi:inner membrane protein
VDNLTHTLTGVALAQSGLGRTSRGATAALVLASNIPDVDLVFGLQGAAAYLQHHRDLSHSVLGGPLLALVLAVCLRLALRGSRFVGLLLSCLAGVAVHVAMDLATSYGTRVLSPFNTTFYAWDLVFIVDPIILGILVTTVILARRPQLGHRAASVGLGLILAYMGGRAVLHARALDEATARVPGGHVQRVAALPHPLDLRRWRVLADTGPAYWTGEVQLGGAAAPLQRRDKLVENATVARVRAESEVAAIFLAFSRFPWLEVHETAEGTAVTWRDLRFERRGRDSFVTRVVVGPDGRIRSQAFHF